MRVAAWDHDPMSPWRLIAAFVLIPIAFAAAFGVWWVTGWRGETAGLVGGLTGYGLATVVVWLLWDPDAPAQISRWARRLRSPSRHGPRGRLGARDSDVL
jgi:uncharacterized membrane protein